MQNPAEDRFNSTMHAIEHMLDHAQREAAQSLIDLMRALLAPHKLHRHTLFISVNGLTVQGFGQDVRYWYEARAQDRGVGLVINTIGHQLDQLADDQPAIFRRLLGTTL